MTIEIHGAEGFAGMRKAGQLAAKILDHITPLICEGMTTNEIDQICSDIVAENNAIAAPLNYHPKGFTYPFPKSVCTSVNEVICHGVPSDRKLKNGDIVNVDVTVIVDGWHGDSSRMYMVGNPSIKAKNLVSTTYEAMMLGIEQVRPGATLGDIGHAIQSYVEKQGFSVVRDYCGHGIGKIFHTEPSVLHYGKAGTGTVLEEGMFFTIEPMVNQGNYKTRRDNRLIDDPIMYEWTIITSDLTLGKRSLSAQFEHSIGVTKDGCEIFTQSAS